MGSPWAGPRARRQLIVAGLILLASIALFAVVIRRAQTELGGAATPQAEPYAVLEVLPSPQSTTNAVEAIRALADVAGVQRYVVAVADERDAPRLRVVGVDVTVPLRVPGAQRTTAPELVNGRAFGPDDAERAVAVVGRDYAKRGKTIYGYQIAGMIDHNPPIRLGGAEVQIIGMFATGDPAADDQVLLPLATAERLFGLAGQANGLYVQVDAPANVDRVERELRAVLGENAIIMRRVS